MKDIKWMNSMTWIDVENSIHFCLFPHVQTQIISVSLCEVDKFTSFLYKPPYLYYYWLNITTYPT